jgi:hypothetical protein
MQIIEAGSTGLAGSNILITNEAGDIYYLAIDVNTTAGFIPEIYIPAPVDSDVPEWYPVFDICGGIPSVASTATDSIAFVLYERPYAGNLKHAVAFAAPESPGTVAKTSETVCLKKTGRNGKAYALFGSKTGTDDQTVQGLIKIGLAN